MDSIKTNNIRKLLLSYYISRHTSKLIDLAFVQADVILECIRGTTNRRINALQYWLFIQNQKLHGVDIPDFCKSTGDAAN